MPNFLGRYSPVSSDDADPTRKPVVRNKVSRFQQLQPFLLFFAFGLAFAAGRFSSSAPKSPLSPQLRHDEIPLKTGATPFTYNRTFGEAPSRSADSAWDSLFPTQGGFFRHPALAPERSAFSVFHQLHCLNGIRMGYWRIHEIARSGSRLDSDAELPKHISPPHIRHCIDLLRQSLMCRPDLTVEVKDEGRGGVRGFGTEHVCEDWSELLRWMEEWEGYRSGGAGD